MNKLTVKKNKERCSSKGSVLLEEGGCSEVDEFIFARYVRHVENLLKPCAKYSINSL